MIAEDIFSGISFPAPIDTIFDKVISIGWYDGTTSGMALHSLRSLAYRFDLLDWGPFQELRVFALSPLAFQDFEQAVTLYSQLETPEWPVWYSGWPSDAHQQKRMGLELDVVLSKASRPEFAFASQSRFETILAAKRLTSPTLAFLPVKFDDQPNGGFDYWQAFLGLPA